MSRSAAKTRHEVAPRGRSVHVQRALHPHRTPCWHGSPLVYNYNDTMYTLNNIIDSYFEKDEADFNILSESNPIDSLYYGIDDLHKCDVVKRNHNICSMHLNIRSLPGKFDKLKLLLSQLDNVNVNIDFILICETYRIKRNHDLYHLPGYNFISRHRKQTKCGGVGMYISDKYNYIIRDDISLFEEHSFADMPPGTDCPYPIRILAFFEMIRPYHIVIRI